MQYDNLLDRAMSYVPEELQAIVIVGLLILAIVLLIDRRQQRPKSLDNFIDVIRDQAVAAATLQKDLSAMREHIRLLSLENDKLKTDFNRLTEDVKALISHSRRLIEIARRLDDDDTHERELRGIERQIDHIDDDHALIP